MKDRADSLSDSSLTDSLYDLSTGEARKITTGLETKRQAVTMTAKTIDGSPGHEVIQMSSPCCRRSNGEGQSNSAGSTSPLLNKLSRTVSVIFDRNNQTCSDCHECISDSGLKEQRTIHDGSINHINHTLCDLKFSGETKITLETQPKKVTIDDINDHQILARLRDFSRNEHTEENLDFLVRVSEFRKSGGSRTLAADIICEFVKRGSLRAVNISSDAREELLRNYCAELAADPATETLPVTLFDEAFDEINMLVKQDILVRFNSKFMSGQAKTVIKPSRFRKMMLGMSVANIVCFLIIAGLTFFTYTYIYFTTEDTNNASRLVGEVLESNSAANLLIRGVAYAGTEQYVAAYEGKIAEFQSELRQLSDINSEYALNSTEMNTQQHLMTLEHLIIYERTVANNKTAAIEILNSADYNTTLENFNATIYALGDQVQHNSDKQSKVISICAVVGMCIVVVALLYTIPSTLYLIAYERRHTKQMMKLTRLLDSALREHDKLAPPTQSRPITSNSKPNIVSA